MRIDKQLVGIAAAVGACLLFVIVFKTVIDEPLKAGRLPAEASASSEIAFAPPVLSYERSEVEPVLPLEAGSNQAMPIMEASDREPVDSTEHDLEQALAESLKNFEAAIEDKDLTKDPINTGLDVMAISIIAELYSQDRYQPVLLDEKVPLVTDDPSERRFLGRKKLFVFSTYEYPEYAELEEVIAARDKARAEVDLASGGQFPPVFISQDLFERVKGKGEQVLEDLKKK